MSPNETKLFTETLQQCRGKYFEWGCGGSTGAVCACPAVQHITSVESSQPWIDKVSADSAVEIAKKNKKIDFIYVDINANDKAFGQPKDQTKIGNWPKYPRAINRDAQKYDLILIDGRFRVACALCALVHLTDKGVVLIHDYVDRPHYHCIERFYDKVRVCETLVAFKKKATYDQIEVEKLLKKYEIIFS